MRSHTANFYSRSPPHGLLITDGHDPPVRVSEEPGACVQSTAPGVPRPGDRRGPALRHRKTGLGRHFPPLRSLHRYYRLHIAASLDSHADCTESSEHTRLIDVGGAT